MSSGNLYEKGKCLKVKEKDTFAKEKVRELRISATDEVKLEMINLNERLLYYLFFH